MIMPSHAKNVKQYQETLPLFARYQVESYLGAMFNPTVQLKSGGYIVIGVTEALVAIDVNSGRATKEGSIEETALKTNLEAADEVARQLRLRDLAGLIVIDFIDMDERKNNTAVEKRVKDRLKTDRARIQVGRISGFGLMEMSRQRLRPGMIEATTQPCQACHGTGLIRSDDNLALSILRQIEEEGTRGRSREVLVRVPVGIANFLINQKREHIAQIEARYRLSVRVEGDPHLISPEFNLEKFKTATRSISPASLPVVSVDTSIMDQVDEDDRENSSGSGGDEWGSDDGENKPKRRRRRRRRSRSKTGSVETSEIIGEDNGGGPDAVSDNALASENVQGSESATEEISAESMDEKKSAGDSEKPRKTRSGSSSKKSSKSKSGSKEKEPTTDTVNVPAMDSANAEPSNAQMEPQSTADDIAETKKPQKTRTSRSSAKAKTDVSAAEVESERTTETDIPTATNGAPAATAANVDIAVTEAPPDAPKKPKKRGWWSLGS